MFNRYIIFSISFTVFVHLLQTCFATTCSLYTCRWQLMCATKYQNTFYLTTHVLCTLHYKHIIEYTYTNIYTLMFIRMKRENYTLWICAIERNHWHFFRLSHQQNALWNCCWLCMFDKFKWPFFGQNTRNYITSKLTTSFLPIMI